MDSQTDNNVPIEKHRRVRHSIAVALIFISGVFLLFSGTLPHLWIMVFGLSVTAIAITLLARPERMLTFLFVSIVVLGLIGFSVHGVQMKKLWHESKADSKLIANSETIITELEKYRKNETDSYPLSIKHLEDAGFKQTALDNPFYCDDRTLWLSLSQEEKNAFEHMQSLSMNGLPYKISNKLPLYGNYCYLPRIEKSEDGNYFVHGYSLLTFSKRHFEPGNWEGSKDLPTVVFYYNSETGVRKTWEK